MRRKLMSLMTALAVVGALSPQAVASPDPTEESVRAERGPYEVIRTVVAGGSGFNRGTLYYPTEGTYAAIAVVPGFVEGEFTQAWFGPALASHGFVVLTLETNSLFDFPDQRAAQLLSALDWLVSASPARDRVDPTRLGVMGHSMGGGGSLSAANQRPSIKAAVALTPWHTTKSFPRIEAATLILGADADWIASVGGHAEPMYEQLNSPDERAYAELAGNHFITNSYTPTTMRFLLPWLKRFLDNDTRYSAFICPGPTKDPTYIEYRNTCPA